MPLLDAMLAFALTMLALATIITVGVQIVHDALRMKARGLERMLANFYEHDLKEALGDKADDLLKDADQQAAAFAKRLGADRATGKLGLKARQTTMTRLPPSEFVKRFRATKLGQNIEEQLDQQAEKLFAVIASQYEVAAAAASDLLARKARWLAIALGLALAAVANVDAIRLLDTYMNNEEARSRVVANADALVEQFRTVEANAARDGIPGGDAAADLDEIREKLDAASDMVRRLETQGFPIGQTLFPYCPAESADIRCATYWRRLEAALKPTGQTNWASLVGTAGPKNGCDEAGRFFGPNSAVCREAVNDLGIVIGRGGGMFWSWVLGVLVTGLLLGLGAPFWYDVIRGITQAAQTLRGRGDGSSSAGRRRRVLS